jgi:sugar phosphate isomerase/epimerase
MFKFSCADFTFPVLERIAALRLIKLLGFDHVDIGLFARSTHFSPTDLFSSPRSYTEQVLQDLDAAELRASDVFVQIGIDPSERAANDPSPAVRAENSEVFKRTVEFAVALGSKHLTGLPGVFHEGVSRDSDLGIAAEVAAWRASQCASAGIGYAIEPHAGSICGDVANTQAFLHTVKGPTLTLDYGHFVMAGESSAQVHALLPFASHVHARGGAIGRLQTSVEENAIDFPGMLAGLRHVGYGGFLALEYVWIDWKGCNRTDNISETILLRRALESTIAEAAMNVASL